MPLMMDWSISTPFCWKLSRFSVKNVSMPSTICGSRATRSGSPCSMPVASCCNISMPELRSSGSASDMDITSCPIISAPTASSSGIASIIPCATARSIWLPVATTSGSISPSACIICVMASANAWSEPSTPVNIPLNAVTMLCTAGSS